MRVRWHGHSYFEFGDSEITVVINPHDECSISIKPPAVTANVVLVTHNHYNHNAIHVVNERHDDVFMR